MFLRSIKYVMSNFTHDPAQKASPFSSVLRKQGGGFCPGETSVKLVSSRLSKGLEICNLLCCWMCHSELQKTV